MKKVTHSWRLAGIAGLILVTGLASSGCATRRFVRNNVNEKARELSARIDKTDQGVQANSNQVQELSSVTRDHTGKIASLDSGLKQTEERTQQALSVGEGAQNTANQVVAQVSSLDVKFQNRNHYQVLSEEKVLFQFNSATIGESYHPALDEFAQKLKQDPNAILVMEGRTDSTGSDAYNIQLGEKRLEAVIRYLVVAQGAPMQKVYRMSFGKEHPVGANNTREGRAENRAVVMRLMGPSAAASSAGMVSEATQPK